MRKRYTRSVVLQHGRLRQARLGRGLTQTELATIIGVPQSTIARLETAKHEPSLRIALLLAAVLESTVEALFGMPDLVARSARAALTAGSAHTDREDTSMSGPPITSPDDETTAGHPKYKVERQLRAAFPSTLKPQRSGASVDVRLYFREKPDGSLWGGLALLDDRGEIAENMPLDSPGALPWLLGVLCDLGFEAAPRKRTQPRGAA